MTALAWLGLAGLLAIVEIFAPGAVLIWFAFGSALVSLWVWLVPQAVWQVQLVLFLTTSSLSLIVWRLRAARSGTLDPAQSINQRLVGLIGQTGELASEISYGKGRVRLGDTTWTVAGPNLPKGAAVRIIGVKDDILLCEPAS